MKAYILILLLLASLPSFAQMSLEDIGLKEGPEQTDPMLEKTMKKRHDMLKTHEILGLATWGLMTATMFTGGSALDSNTHMNLGIATGALYAATAFFSFTAPKPDGIKDKTRMIWHKRLAWVHLPLMIIVPYLGYMYKKHDENDQKHNSFEKQHSSLAGVLYGTFTISAALMVIEF